MTNLKFKIIIISLLAMLVLVSVGIWLLLHSKKPLTEREITQQAATQKALIDTDKDGYPDATENLIGTDPKVFTTQAQYNEAMAKYEATVGSVTVQ